MKRFIVLLTVIFYSCSDGENGVYVHKYDNGDVKEVGTLIKGKTEGVVVEYTEEGKVKEFKTYIGGKLNGRYISFDTSGPIFKDFIYEDDVLQKGTYFAIIDEGRKRQDFFRKGEVLKHYSRDTLVMLEHDRSNSYILYTIRGEIEFMGRPGFFEKDDLEEFGHFFPDWRIQANKHLGETKVRNVDRAKVEEILKSGKKYRVPSE